MDKKSLTLPVVVQVIVGAALLLSAAVGVVNHIMNGDGVKIAIGLLILALAVVVLLGAFRIYTHGLPGIIDLLVSASLLILIAAFSWDLLTTMNGIHSMMVSGDAVLSTESRSLAAGFTILLTALVGIVLLSCGIAPKMISAGIAPPGIAWIYWPFYVLVAAFDWWTSYEGTSQFIWKVSANQLPLEKWVLMVFGAAMISIFSIVLGALIPWLANPGTDWGALVGVKNENTSKRRELSESGVNRSAPKADGAGETSGPPPVEAPAPVGDTEKMDTPGEPIAAATVYPSQQGSNA